MSSPNSPCSRYHQGLRPALLPPTQVRLLTQFLTPNLLVSQARFQTRRLQEARSQVTQPQPPDQDRTQQLPRLRLPLQPTSPSAPTPSAADSPFSDAATDSIPAVPSVGTYQPVERTARAAERQSHKAKEYADRAVFCSAVCVACAFLCMVAMIIIGLSLLGE